jgi:two-component sensor histidine kinase
MWRLHGEAVPLDDARVSDFNGLHSRRRDAEVQFYAFHILVSRRRRHSRKTLFVKPERALVTLIQTSALSTVAEQNLVGGVLVVCRDVTAEHKAREALSLINEELKHRVRNTLAVLGAVATQTFRQEASKADLEKYLARLAAFGRAHDLLTAANWASAPLQDVISTALTPYGVGEGRFMLSGPPLIVKSRQALALSLALHELATNALKNGALSVESGQVSITWSSENPHGEPKFVFVWQESGGPPPSGPDRVGFGSRLISRALEDDFRGSVEVTFGSTGLICSLTAPLQNLETQGAD